MADEISNLLIEWAFLPKLSAFFKAPADRWFCHEKRKSHQSRTRHSPVVPL